jgi:RNA polymerase sigma factor (sigma-70 family)
MNASKMFAEVAVDFESGSFSSLLSQAQKGDPVAQEHLLEKHRAWLKRMAQQALSIRLSRRNDASDLAQECLMAASHNIGRFEGRDEGTLRGWLGAIQRNLLRKVFRSQIAKIENECDLPQSSHGGVLLEASQTSVFGRVAQRELVATMIEAMEALDEEDRILVQCKYFADDIAAVTYEELAEQFGCTSAALRQRMCRILKRLATGIRLLETANQYQIPLHHRRILVWQCIRGWTASQIGAELECDLAEAKQRILEAEKQLPKRWQQSS